jgi:hypothetical protein
MGGVPHGDGGREMNFQPQHINSNFMRAWTGLWRDPVVTTLFGHQRFVEKWHEWFSVYKQWL